MKHARFLSALVLGPVFLCLHAGGALINTGQNPSSPYYADFNSVQLGINYGYNSSTGVGTFTVANVGGTVKNGEQYNAGSLSPGTHGANNSSSFAGFYSMTATILNVGGTGTDWQLTGGSFTIEGSLFSGGQNTDILLSGTLKTGAGNFGWANTKTANEFDFLFTTGSSGDSRILTDFFGSGTGEGAIKLHEGTATSTTYTGDLTQNWTSISGNADTFVPEPGFYPFAAAGIAMVGLVLASRKSGSTSTVVA